MAGLSKRFCSEACPWREDAEQYRGLCGSCHGKYYPCDEDGNNCGKWQCEESQTLNCCLEGICGDGQNCPRYIDIEFTLDPFVIQGKTCCNAAVPLAQQCNGDQIDPYDGEPSGWGNTTGILDAVIYEKTDHKIRLTRSACGCFWGGYWSSSCNCSKCCCYGDETCDEGSIYPECNGEPCGVDSCLLGCGQCFDGCGSCRACDPSIPCAATDDGYASSLDRYGTGNLGGSDGSAICAAPSVKFDPLDPDACGYLSGVCNDWIDDGTPAHACYTCGDFKPHHIQAMFTYVSTEGSCNSAWVLQIRGLTELTASQLGNSTEPYLDCNPSGLGGCNHIGQAGGAYAGMGYIGMWEGREGVCNLACDQSGDESAIPEFAFQSCGCPPTTVINSTIEVRNSLEAFHPASVFGEGGDDGVMHTCVVKDSEGSQPSETWCQDNDGAWSSVCIDQQPTYPSGTTTGTCYGNPALWWNRCRWCGGSGGAATCCDTGGCTPDSEGVCGACGTNCDCVPPVGRISDGGMASDIYPCSHCGAGDDPSNNHYSCNPCQGGNVESRACAPCRISIKPNNSVSPHWEQNQ